VAQTSFNLTFGVQRWFFDSDIVKKMMDGKTREALNRSGALVRMIARRSMRYVTSLGRQEQQVAAGDRKRVTGAPAPSAPGTPPHAVQPHPWIRDFLWYAYDPASHTVVVGPVRLPNVGDKNIPALQEFGGRTMNRNKRRAVRRIGSGGEVRVQGLENPVYGKLRHIRPGATTKPAVNAQGQTVMVTYARLRSAEQVRRATELNAALYGAMYHAATYPPRPFMAPALAVARPSLPKFWAASVAAAGAA
jgi:hypothetical protein